MGVAAGLVVGMTACTDENSDAGTVVSITDGDTLVASVNGSEQTIRLLNIDTPETKDPDKPVECMGPEATDFLAGLLPVGSDITLMYDVERTDKYERTLAAVFTPDDKFVSAEIARAGLGTAVAFGKNTKFLPPVEEADAEAKADGQGIHDAEVECTLPAQIEAATAALEGVTGAAGAAAPSTAAAAGAAITASAVVIASAQTLLAALRAGAKGADVVRWAAFTDAELAGHVTALSGSVQEAETQVEVLQDSKTTLAAAEKAAEEKAAAEKAAAEAAAAAEAERVAAERAAAEAAAAAEAQRIANEAAASAEAERIRNLPPVYVPPAPAPYVPPVPAPPVQNSGGGYDGYTGPRCYLPGGKSYRPC